MRPLFKIVIEHRCVGKPPNSVPGSLRTTLPPFNANASFMFKMPFDQLLQCSCWRHVTRTNNAGYAPLTIPARKVHHCLLIAVMGFCESVPRALIEKVSRIAAGTVAVAQPDLLETSRIFDGMIPFGARHRVLRSARIQSEALDRLEEIVTVTHLSDRTDEFFLIDAPLAENLDRDLDITGHFQVVEGIHYIGAADRFLRQKTDNQQLCQGE